jgi:3-deoxy-D-manno-octulosonic acid kinase
MPLIETFPIGTNQFVFLPKQGGWLPESNAHNDQLDSVQKLFEPSFLSSENLITNTASGRGLVHFFSALGEKCVLRHYYRGGLIAKVSKDTFIYQGLKKTRPYQELNLLTKLHNAGLNVAKPLAARVTRNGFTYTADIITGAIENAQELHEIIMHNPLEQSVWKKIGATLRQMHDLQACHYDINVKNVLLHQSPEDVFESLNKSVYLLDFDGCKIRSGEQWKAANLKRFKRSLEKQSAKFSTYFYDEECWKALESGYHL